MPGDGASGGQAVCRPRGVEHLQDVPRVFIHSNLGEKTSRGIRLCFSLQCYHSKFYSLCQAVFSLLANKNFQNKNGSVTLGSNRRRRSRSAMGKCSKLRLYTPQIEGADPHGKIIRAAPGKAATGDFPSHFQPLSPHFFDRADW